MLDEVVVYFDGGARGNPGPAAIGAVVLDPSSAPPVRLAAVSERIGETTNNVAEYRALIEGLKMALAYHPNRLICHLDSELVVKQLNGEYQVKVAALKPYVEEIRELAQEFADIVFVHIPREDNHRADALVNKALDELPDPSPHIPHTPKQGSLFTNEPKSPGDLYREQHRQSPWH